MAKIKLTAFLADIRGKNNGTVFSKNRGGAYVRTKVTPSNPQTSFQQLVRQRLAALSAQFRSLSAAQILAWNNAVQDFQTTNVFGDTVSPSGQQLYVKLNSNLANVGEPPISVPPAPIGLPVMEMSIASLTDSAFTLSLSAIPTTMYYVIEATAPVSAGRNFLKNEYRQISVVTGTGSAIPASNIFAAYSAKFGAPVSSQRVGVRVKVITGDTGQSGIPVSANDIVA